MNEGPGAGPAAGGGAGGRPVVVATAGTHRGVRPRRRRGRQGGLARDQRAGRAVRGPVDPGGARGPWFAVLSGQGAWPSPSAASVHCGTSSPGRLARLLARIARRRLPQLGEAWTMQVALNESGRVRVAAAVLLAQVLARRGARLLPEPAAALYPPRAGAVPPGDSAVVRGPFEAGRDRRRSGRRVALRGAGVAGRDPGRLRGRLGRRQRQPAARLRPRPVRRTRCRTPSRWWPSSVWTTRPGRTTSRPRSCSPTRPRAGRRSTTTRSRWTSASTRSHRPPDPGPTVDRRGADETTASR